MELSMQSTMQELVEEYARISGKMVKSFKSKSAGLAAIEKASKKKLNGETQPPIVAVPIDVPMEPAMPKAAKPKAANGPEDRAARVWATENGAGGLIVQLLKQKKLDDEGIVSTVLKKFPKSRAKVGTVQWYKSMGKRSGWKG